MLNLTSRTQDTCAERRLPIRVKQLITANQSTDHEEMEGVHTQTKDDRWEYTGKCKV